MYGCYMHIETLQGIRKSTVIVPEPDNNRGWGDIAGKILHFLGKHTTNRFKHSNTPQTKSYIDTAKIAQWPELAKFPATVVDKVIKVNPATEDSNHQFLSRCLVGTFNDSFNHSPNQEVIQKWLLNRWKICAGMKVTPLSHNQFLFELPSRQEAGELRLVNGSGMDDV